MLGIARFRWPKHPAVITYVGGGQLLSSRDTYTDRSQPDELSNHGLNLKGSAEELCATEPNPRRRGCKPLFLLQETQHSLFHGCCVALCGLASGNNIPRYMWPGISLACPPPPLIADLGTGISFLSHPSLVWWHRMM